MALLRRARPLAGLAGLCVWQGGGGGGEPSPRRAVGHERWARAEAAGGGGGRCFAGWDADWDRLAHLPAERPDGTPAAPAPPGKEDAAVSGRAAAADAALPAGATTKGEVPLKSRRPCRYVYLVRHGQYSHASRSHFPGVSEESRRHWDMANSLTELGRLQATLTGARLREVAAAGGFMFDAVHHSDQARAAQTAELVVRELGSALARSDVAAASGARAPNGPAAVALAAEPTALPVYADAGLREGNPAAPVPASPSYKPSARSIEEDGARIEAAFRRYFYRPPLEQTHDTHEVVVCHGNVIRFCVCRALQVDPQAWLRLSVYNCGITTVRIASHGGVSVSQLGDTGHLPAAMVTYQ
jgi:broad specificity phosphatase PhoE